MDGVEFRRVSYRITGGAPILDDFSLTVGAGETFALVGARQPAMRAVGARAGDPRGAVESVLRRLG